MVVVVPVHILHLAIHPLHVLDILEVLNVLKVMVTIVHSHVINEGAIVIGVYLISWRETVRLLYVVRITFPIVIGLQLIVQRVIKILSATPW